MIKILLPLLLLAGCASSELSGSDFTRPGVTSAQRMSDTSLCLDYADRGPATAAGPQGNTERSDLRNERFVTCMRDRGYRPI